MNIKLLKKLDFSNIISKAKPITEAGKELLKSYSGYLFSNEANYALVNNFLREAREFTFDRGIEEALQKTTYFIGKNSLSWQLASVCENLSARRPAYDALAKNAVRQVDKLLEGMDEKDVRQYIKAGALKNVQYIPEIRRICKQVYSESVTECVTPTYKVEIPLSFVETKNGKHYFTAAGQVYKADKGTITEAASPSQHFDKVNTLLSQVARTDDGIEYEYLARQMKFSINEERIEVTTKSGKNFKFSRSSRFDEWRDTVCRGIFGTPAKTEFMRVTEAMETLFDAMENIGRNDCARIVETSNGAKFVIVEGENNVIVRMISESTPDKKVRTYNTVLEALRDVENETGINLQPAYESRIVREAKKAGDRELMEQEARFKAGQKDDYRRRIEKLTEQYKNDPVRLAVVNRLAKEIAKI